MRRRRDRIVIPRIRSLVSLVNWNRMAWRAVFARPLALPSGSPLFKSCLFAHLSMRIASTHFGHPSVAARCRQF